MNFYGTKMKLFAQGSKMEKVHDIRNYIIWMSEAFNDDEDQPTIANNT